MVKQKTVYSLHGWGGVPEGGYRPWLKRELEQRGFIVKTPVLPNSVKPQVFEWLSYLQELITEPYEDVILVGHSLGGQLTLRFLENLPEGAKIGKVLLVAPVIDQIMGLKEEEEKIAKSWLRPIDYGKVKKSTNKIVAMFSDDDPWIPLSSEQVAREQFGAETIIEHGMGHYADDEGLLEAPSILAALLG